MPLPTRDAGPEKFEMAFPRTIVARKARGRDETVNGHPVKLLAFLRAGGDACGRDAIAERIRLFHDGRVLRLGAGDPGEDLLPS